MLTGCPECHASISDTALSCPRCGYPVKSTPAVGKPGWGFEWKTEATIFGLPLIHVAIGRDTKTGRLRVARGIIAVGQFAVGLITIAQFGIGLLFGLGQVTVGILAAGQAALGIYFGIGQFATGMTAVGQLALGRYVLAQVGFGEHVWSAGIKDPVAVEYFHSLWENIRAFLF